MTDQDIIDIIAVVLSPEVGAKTLRLAPAILAALRERYTIADRAEADQ